MTARINQWELQRRALVEDGEIPTVDPPKVRPGVYLRSNALFYEDTERPRGRGGIVLRRADDGDGWQCVEAWRGRVKYHRVRDGEIDWTEYDGIVRTDLVGGTLRALYRDGARGSGTSRYRQFHDHGPAIVKLTAILESPGAASNTDEAVL